MNATTMRANAPHTFAVCTAPRVFLPDLIDAASNMSNDTITKVPLFAINANAELTFCEEPSNTQPLTPMSRQTVANFFKMCKNSNIGELRSLAAEPAVANKSTTPHLKKAPSTPKNATVDLSGDTTPRDPHTLPIKKRKLTARGVQTTRETSAKKRKSLPIGVPNGFCAGDKVAFIDTWHMEKLKSVVEIKPDAYDGSPLGLPLQKLPPNIKMVCQDFNGHKSGGNHTQQHATRLAVHREVCMGGDDCPVFGCKCEQTRKTFECFVNRNAVDKYRSYWQNMNHTNMSNASRADGKGVD